MQIQRLIRWFQGGLLLAVAIILVLGGTACSQDSVGAHFVQPSENMTSQVSVGDRLAPQIEGLQTKLSATFETVDHGIALASQQATSIITSAKATLDEINQQAVTLLDKALDNSDTPL